MADPNRLKVDSLVLHHAVTPLWEEKSKPQLAQWFSDLGFSRGYGSNPANWSGLINPYTGARSYAMAHYAGQRVTSATPDASAAEKAAGYRLVQLVQDPWGQITWHAGNWNFNQRSIGIENLGDYRNYTLREGDCRVIADFWRPQDVSLGGTTMVYGHKEVSSLGTECPARIMEQRNHIIDLINNPPVVKPVWQAYVAKPKAKVKLQPIDVVTHASVGNTVAAGVELDIASRTTWEGIKYLRTRYATEHNTNTGIREDQTQLTTVVVKDETVKTVIPFSIKKEDDPSLPVGEEKVVTPGVNGERTVVYAVTYTNGVETSRVVKSDTVTKQPVEQVVKVGTMSKDDEQDKRLSALEAALKALTAAVAYVIKFLSDTFKGFKP